MTPRIDRYTALTLACTLTAAIALATAESAGAALLFVLLVAGLRWWVRAG